MRINGNLRMTEMEEADFLPASNHALVKEESLQLNNSRMNEKCSFCSYLNPIDYNILLNNVGKSCSGCKDFNGFKMVFKPKKALSTEELVNTTPTGNIHRSMPKNANLGYSAGDVL